MKKGAIGNLHQVLLLVILIVIGTIGRYLLVAQNLQPFPNFEIIMVLTFLAAILMRSSLAIAVPLCSMIFSDLLIGNPIFVGSQMNRIVLFTYSGFAMIALVNIFNRKRFKRGLGEIKLANIGIAAGLGVGFVLLYDIWTNIGWWYLIYPHTLSSLATVFTAGIPFMIYHLISGVVTFLAIALPVTAFVHQNFKLDLPKTVKTIQKIPVVLLVVLLIALSFTGTALKMPTRSEIWLEEVDQTSVTLVIRGDDWILEDHYLAYADDTAFTILQRAASDHELSLEYTYYEQFDSLLVDSVNHDVNGENNRYWQYYVNEEIPMIGADKYSVKNGDYLEWRFEIISY